jgi:hypothetical protein
MNLATETEFLKQTSVPVEVFTFKIVEQTTTLAHDLEQATTRMMILRIRLEMLLKSGDSLRKKRDLNFRRTRVGVASFMSTDDFGLLCCRDQVL